MAIVEHLLKFSESWKSLFLSPIKEILKRRLFIQKFMNVPHLNSYHNFIDFKANIL